MHSDHTSHIQLNLRVRGLSCSATLAINERCDALRREGRRVFGLGLGQSPFPVPEIVVEALKQNAHQKEYLPVNGLPELRAAVADHHVRTFGIECTPENILVGPGSKELMFILQLAYYGDLVIPTPTWVSYAPQAQIIGRQVHFLPTRAENGWRLTADQLEALCRTDPGRPRLLVLNYPSNPTGGSYTLGELQELAEVARRYRLLILSDEIYAKLHHSGRHRSIVPLYPEGTIFSGGLSKWCGAGGWRLGLFVFPDSLRSLLEAMAVVASETFTSTSAPIQYAAVRAFQKCDEIEAYLQQSRRILASLGRHLAHSLNSAGVQTLVPEGGFYLFPDFRARSEVLEARGIQTSVELCDQLLRDTGVAILPGRDFGRPAEELTARIAYVNFDGEKALKAATELPTNEPLTEAFLASICPETIAAVDLLCDWLTA